MTRKERPAHHPGNSIIMDNNNNNNSEINNNNKPHLGMMMSDVSLAEIPPMSTNTNATTTTTNHTTTMNSSTSFGSRSNRRFYLMLGVILVIVMSSILSLHHHHVSPSSAVAMVMKAVDVNGPPEGMGNSTASTTDGSSSQKRKKKSRRGENDDAFVIVENTDDEIPSGIFPSYQHAADVLECRESVVSFVINATDAKDECDGLKRAFDKTCNSDAAESDDVDNNENKDDNKNAKSDVESSERTNHESTNVDSNPTSRRRQQRSRRKLSSSLQAVYHPTTLYKRWNALIYKTTRWFMITLIRQPHAEVQQMQFFAEDAVVGHAWEDATYLVDHDLDHIVHEPLQRQLRTELSMDEMPKDEMSTDENQRDERPMDEIQMDETSMSPPRILRQLVDDEDEDPIDANETLSKTRWDQDTTTGEEEIDDRGNQEKNETDASMDIEFNKTKDVEDEAFFYNNDTNATEAPSAATTTTIITKKIIENKPRKSLTLPTLNQHISEQMLSETLLLQKDQDTIQEEIFRGAAANSTKSGSYQNGTFASAKNNEAIEDAVASKKAVQDTTLAVSAVLNDPTSVEARTCCASILNVFHESCDVPNEEVVSDRKLFLIVFVIALCGLVKSLIRFYSLRWLPEAAGCILVGVVCGAIMSFVPHYDISFDGDWFLRIMVPPIVFEAALSIDKRSFNRHIWPIMIYSVLGTLMATGITAYILHKGTSMISACETIPYVESLTFGALISSIDPIAVLSVLSSMGMTDTDTIYVLIFGESLLNDGVSIVLFETLVHFLDESLVIDRDAVIAAAIHFLVVASGSLCVGIGSGIACSAYYWMMQGCQTPLVEVLLFFCWAFIPYYICDGIGWSGIVAVVATGFVMDLYVVGQFETPEDGNAMVTPGRSREHDSKAPRRGFFSLHGHLSALAKTHVHFVGELLSTMMETAIFAYLGVFLFSYRYHWNFFHTFMSILACCVSRAIMIPLLSLVANWVAKVQEVRAVWYRKRGRHGGTLSELSMASAPSAGVTINCKMQLVLWVAGLRGAMSFALVENIPMYDTVTREGSRIKPELKAMTSATIVFTVFMLGGYTYYLMEHLGMAPSKSTHNSTDLMSPLVVKKRTGSEVAMSDHNKADVRHRRQVPA